MSVRLANGPAQPLTVRRVIVGLAATAAVLAMAGKADPQGATTSPVGGVRCEEDMPCWDCSSMGNRICGPIQGETAP